MARRLRMDGTIRPSFYNNRGGNVLKSNNTFSHDLAALLGKYPNVDATAMGFPMGWQEETLWR